MRLIQNILTFNIGAYAECIATSTRMLIHKPASLSWEEVAGIPETGITATQALHLVGCFRPGDRVLFHAGASSVSIAGIQLALAAGASAIFITAGSDEKVAFCEKLGEKKGFNYHKDD
jgi:NADPH:quinone reductase-like Zn-dependent oxidoreductase